MRPSVSAASIVCSVESTRCPDSAACRAVSAVSESRSSPIRITSGSARRPRRRASLNEPVSIPDLALVDDALAVGVDDLDRILDREDVLAARAVDVVDDRRERRGLARARRARHQHEPAVLLCEPLDTCRQAELLEPRDDARDDAEGVGGRPALPEAVHAEARQPGGGVRRVELARREERLRHAPGSRRTRASTPSRSALGEPRPFDQLGHLAVAAEDRRPADLQMDVARTELDGALKEDVELHGRSIGSDAPGL